MKYKVLTLFPEYIDSIKDYSIIKRAIEAKKIDIEAINIRDFGIGKHKQVDDTPFGGGVGMVMRVDVLHTAIKQSTRNSPKNKRVVLLSPEGNQYDQKKALEYSSLDELILICGHYEGFDERIKEYVDETVSIGDYILTGGETGALAIIESSARLIKGVLGKNESHRIETFSLFGKKKYIEYPHYTKPREFLGHKIPEVLLSGDHKKIEKWKLDNLKYID